MNTERTTAEMDEEFVVFLIGMRINTLWKVHKWVPVFAAMPRMLRELERDEESGLLGYELLYRLPRRVVTVQYWDSFETLREYAQDVEREHVPAWVEYNKENAAGGDVGIFHETYVVGPDDYETVYNQMPAFGLGAAGDLVPASGHRESAGGRIGRTDGDDAPVAPDGTVDGEQQTGE